MLGACIIEPVVQGAGGMRLIDPEFHRAMDTVCKVRCSLCLDV
jgi:adenosylmethionine-8-amino-7-oxononanoate aminotransferase